MSGRCGTAQALTPYAEAFATEDDVRGPVNWYRAAFRSAVGGKRAQLAPIAVPVLVIWGVHDAFLGQEMVAREALRTTMAFPNEATVVPIGSAGHFVQNEAPEEVTRTLLEWLAESDPAAP